MTTGKCPTKPARETRAHGSGPRAPDGLGVSRFLVSEVEMNKRIVEVVILVATLLTNTALGSAKDAARLDIERTGYVGFSNRDAWPKGEAALTFDDGPHPGCTPRVLDLLALHGIRATFFLVGKNITSRTFPLVQRMLREGHAIGSHSYNHDVRMALREGAGTVDYIRGQHESTQILIDIALLSQTAEDFDARFARVFEQKPTRYLSHDALTHNWPDFVKRHQALLRTEGFETGQRPYRVAFARPPGGGPYMGSPNQPARLRHDQALEQLGWMNVLWHNGVWDPDPERLKDYDFVVSSLTSQARHGGVLVIHDYVRADALAFALKAIAQDKQVTTVQLDAAVLRKYGETTETVLAMLQEGKESSTPLTTPSRPDETDTHEDVRVTFRASSGRPGSTAPVGPSLVTPLHSKS